MRQLTSARKRLNSNRCYSHARAIDRTQVKCGLYAWANFAQREAYGVPFWFVNKHLKIWKHPATYVHYRFLQSGSFGTKSSRMLNSTNEYIMSISDGKNKPMSCSHIKALEISRPFCYSISFKELFILILFESWTHIYECSQRNQAFPTIVIFRYKNPHIPWTNDHGDIHHEIIILVLRRCYCIIRLTRHYDRLDLAFISTYSPLFSSQ